MIEKSGFSINGYVMALLVLPVLQIGSLIGIAQNQGAIWAVVIAVLVAVLWFGFFMVQPNQGKVMTLFGQYVGTVKAQGLRWTIPFFIRKNVSLRIRNFESGKLKVNDNQGNPIEIATIVVWSVSDTAQAIFDVDDFESFVTIQSEAALRVMASSFPYDPRDDEEAEIALRSHPMEIASALEKEIQERLEQAGIRVHEARISHLAYAQEIASAMLQRQQAAAIIAARNKIVEGAVSMVESALHKLEEKGVAELDDEKKAQMVSNLMVVLCGDKNAQPVINTGTLY